MDRHLVLRDEVHFFEVVRTTADLVEAEDMLRRARIIVLRRMEMGLHNVQAAEQDGQRFNSVTPKRIWHAVCRWFDRERELIRLRVTCGMMSEARRSDAREYEEMFEHNRKLLARVRELEEEREAVRQWNDNAAKSNKNPR